MLRRTIAALLIAVAHHHSASAQSRVPLVVDTDWLADRLTDAGVVVLQIGGRDSTYRAEHIPGARFVPYMALVQTVDGISSELPSADSLRALFEGHGVSDATHVVLTGQPLAVTRAFFTLDYLGHARVSALNGGLTKWKRENRATETAYTRPVRGRLTARLPNGGVVATTDWVRERVGKPAVAFFDTRTEGEYLGTEGAAGHIEGARRVEWRDYFTEPDEFTLKDSTSLARLFMERGASPADTVVAYCAVGYRASGTYFVARLLGVPARLYDGSYDAWSKAGLSVTKTPTPLKQSRAPKPSGGGIPFVSPDGRHIAFVAARDGRQIDVYVVDADGSNERRITRTDYNDATTTWFGSRAVVWSGNDTATVRAFDAHGTNERVVARLPGREFRISPDGRSLLFNVGPWLSSQLVVSALDGSDPRVIAQAPPLKFNAAWSPDGKQIAYAVRDSSQLQIGVMRADGTGERILTHFTSEDGSPQWPAWSPDGRRLAIQVGKYSRDNPEANTAHIWTIDIASGKATKLASHERAYLDETPSWFPDGRHIAIQSDRTGIMQIWVIDGHGTSARQVTSWTP